MRFVAHSWSVSTGCPAIIGFIAGLLSRGSQVRVLPGAYQETRSGGGCLVLSALVPIRLDLLVLGGSERDSGLGQRSYG